MAALGILTQTLRLTLNIVDGCPVPGLKTIVGTALAIAETTEAVKQNKDACIELAERASKVSIAICEELRSLEKQQVDRNLMQRIAALQCALDEIKVFVQRMTRKRLLQRIWKHVEIRSEVDRLSRVLTDAVNAFTVRSLVSMDNRLSVVGRNVDDIAETHGALMRYTAESTSRENAILSGNDTILSELSRMSIGQNLYDGAFRLYGRDDLILEVDSEPSSSIDPNARFVQVHRARLRHDDRKVVVVRYCYKEHFNRDLKRLKQVWHPNIRPLLGYSRPDPLTSFIVSDAHETRPWEQVVMSVQGSTRIKYYIQALAQSYSTFSYLVQELPGYTWQRDRTYASLSQFPLMSDGQGNIVYDIHHLWPTLPRGFIMNPWGRYHKVRSYVYEDDLKQLAIPASKHWLEDGVDSDHAHLSWLEQLYEQWLLIRAYSCTETLWPLENIPFPGDVFTGATHLASPTPGVIVHHPDPEGDLDSIFPLLAHSTLTCPSISLCQDVCTLDGWNRYTIPTLEVEDEDFSWHPGWHAYHSFGEGSPRREYDLNHVRLPVQQYLLENIISLSARHSIHDPAKLCLVVTPILYIDTRCTNVGVDGNKPWYLFIRASIACGARVDERPWAYWSPDKDDFPPAAPGVAGEIPAGWTPRSGGTLAYRMRQQDLDAYHEHQWTQEVGETTFEIGLRARVEYVQLLKEEVLLMRELEEYRRKCGSHGRIVEVNS